MNGRNIAQLLNIGRGFTSVAGCRLGQKTFDELCRKDHRKRFFDDDELRCHRLADTVRRLDRRDGHRSEDEPEREVKNSKSKDFSQLSPEHPSM